MRDAGVTAAYTRTHKALHEIAKETSLAPFDVRMLVALHEHKGVLDTSELEEILRCDGAAVRRSMLELRAEGLIASTPKRGTRTRLMLTQRGNMVARRVMLAVS